MHQLHLLAGVLCASTFLHYHVTAFVAPLGVVPSSTARVNSRWNVEAHHSGRSPRLAPALWPLSAANDLPDEPLVLTEENAELVVQAARDTLTTLFGYLPENQKVGITGEVDFVELDGPNIVLRLKGKFWHDRKMVLARVAKFIQDRIPECLEVMVEDPAQLLGDDEESVEQFYRKSLG